MLGSRGLKLSRLEHRAHGVAGVESGTPHGGQYVVALQVNTDVLSKDNGVYASA